ncbi:hypothetical protein BDY17DRAFT_43224 [Neohortaea acidophila]|uniref:Uncharacterized protein n=1 Tax=Neohortaea acidophila TaxID=245834 RepID=A0A6A6PI57_9PEZI|nr:uncharacterized protein BDY17DRAFT_43224 [Neohortaea acidophila]KAF2479682.1 hypothetical protein BDY17DRAFT_43224 [Neohortaea acidophila]
MISCNVCQEGQSEVGFSAAPGALSTAGPGVVRTLLLRHGTFLLRVPPVCRRGAVVLYHKTTRVAVQRGSCSSQTRGVGLGQRVGCGLGRWKNAKSTYITSLGSEGSESMFWTALHTAGTDDGAMQIRAVRHTFYVAWTLDLNMLVSAKARAEEGRSEP